MSNVTNPYQPPRSDVAYTAQEGELLWDASAGRRLANLFLDYLGVMLFAVLIGAFLGFTFALAGHALPRDVARALGAAAWLGYYLLFEGLFGRTPAKLITGTRVVSSDGSAPRFTQILGRTFARLVPFEPFSFLSSQTGWHDRWSRTRVVLVRR